MTPTIRRITAKRLIGISIEMSMIDNKTGSLWGQLMPRINEIKGKVSSDKISLQLYPSDYFQTFNPAKTLTKCAAVEVSEFAEIPPGMETMTIPAGQYAVFHYRGSSADSSIFQYIFGEWLPQSDYQLDDRPHFEVLGEKYRNNDPDSEEEIWIPIQGE